MNRVSLGGFYTLTEWITRFAYVNLLWIGFSLVGVVIFGFFPSTVAMFTIIRKWIMGQTQIPVFKTFWQAYKQEFLRSNGMGLLIALIGALIVIDLLYMKHTDSFLTITHIPIYLFIFAITLTFLYVLPVYVHYDVRFIQIFKNAFLIMLINPISNILMIIGIIGTFAVMKFLPGLFFFFGGSVTAAIMMSGCYFAFKKVDRKKEIIEAN